MIKLIIREENEGFLNQMNDFFLHIECVCAWESTTTKKNDPSRNENKSGLNDDDIQQSISSGVEMMNDDMNRV